MSMQSARDFLKKVQTDKALKERLEAEPDLDVRKKIIQAAGFDFSLSEYRQAVEEVAVAAGEQLTPEELEQVAGGLRRRLGDNIVIPPTVPE